MKYGNKFSGGFHSRKEHKRAEDLKLLEKIGAISELKFQVKFEVIPACKPERAAHYIADFVYNEGSKRIVEDCKGFKTPDYILKRKLMLFRYGISIKET